MLGGEAETLGADRPRHVALAHEDVAEIAVFPHALGVQGSPGRIDDALAEAFAVRLPCPLNVAEALPHAGEHGEGLAPEHATRHLAAKELGVGAGEERIDDLDGVRHGVHDVGGGSEQHARRDALDNGVLGFLPGSDLHGLLDLGVGGGVDDGGQQRFGGVRPAHGVEGGAELFLVEGVPLGQPAEAQGAAELGPVVLVVIRHRVDEVGEHPGLGHVLHRLGGEGVGCS